MTIQDVRNVMTPLDALTEAILDHEDELQHMGDAQREQYRPMARKRAAYIHEWLRDSGFGLSIRHPTI